MGSIFRQQYHITDKHGRKKKRHSKKWYVCFKDASGKWVREPAYEDREASQHMLTRRMREVALSIEGLGDDLTKNIARPLREHLVDFLAHLKDKENTPGHCKQVGKDVTRILDLGGINISPQLTKSRVDSALAKLQDPKYQNPPLSVSTCNANLGSIQHFARWLVDERRAMVNAIDGMKAKSVAGRRTKERRPLSPDEFTKVLSAASTGEPWKGRRKEPYSGRDRLAIYTLAAFTGYRRMELYSVTPDAFEFGVNPVLHVVRVVSKRRKPERIPINREVAAFFERYLAGRPKDKPIWGRVREHTAQMLRFDMDAAGVDHKEGIVEVDFHSLRQCFMTSLARAGVTPKVTQQLARHSDINLTMRVYTKMNDDDERAAVESLPVPSALTAALTERGLTQRNRSQPGQAKKKVAKSNAVSKKTSKK